MKHYSIPWTYRNGKKIRWLDVWAKNIIQAVKLANDRIEVKHEILINRVRRIG